MMGKGHNIAEVRKATPNDVESLTTIIPRSFDTNALLNRLFPSQSLSVRDWWAKVYRGAIESHQCRILLCNDGDKVIGVLTLHLWRATHSATDSFGGICTLVPLIRDHDEILHTALEDQADSRRIFMQDQSNFMIDLMAIDREYQGLGIGKRLVQEACNMADEADVAIFVQTTKAKQYYLKLGLGFESEHGSMSGVVIRPRIGC